MSKGGKFPDICYEVWVGSPITWPDLPTDTFKLPQLPGFVARLSGQSNDLTWFGTWNLQMAKITWFLWPNWVGNLITQPNLSFEISKLPKLPDICHLVEWAVQLPDSISLTQLSGWSIYLTWFAAWNLQIGKITQFLSPGWVGDPITPPSLQLKIYKLPKLPHICHPVEWAI